MPSTHYTLENRECVEKRLKDLEKAFEKAVGLSLMMTDNNK